MSDLHRQLLEDRALRDDALALFKADIELLRNGLGEKSIGERAIERVGEGALEVFDQASEVASSHRGVLAAIIGALVLWFARNPILALLGDEPDDQADAPTDAASG